MMETNEIHILEISKCAKELLVDLLRRNIYVNSDVTPSFTVLPKICWIEAKTESNSDVGRDLALIHFFPDQLTCSGKGG